jgi:gamma-glutamyltranspeptidase/glutathione hydrolase
MADSPPDEIPVSSTQAALPKAPTSAPPSRAFRRRGRRPGFSLFAGLALLLFAMAGPAGARPAEGGLGAVAAEHRLASLAGVEAMRAGGNAIDAAATAMLVTGVVNPSSSGLGGGGFMTVWIAATGTAHALDFREIAPLAAHRDFYLRDGKAAQDASKTGALAVAVPGEPMGIEVALERWGTMTTAEVAAPAIRLAREGFAVERHLADAVARERERIAADPALAAVFLHDDGSPILEGETLFRPDLAATLETFAREGAAPFYKGAVARDIAETIEARGGRLGLRDLAAYEVLEREPLRTSFAGHELLGMPPPSSGGGTIGLVLEVLESYELAALARTDAGYQHLLAETLKAAFADRALWYGDPKYTYVPMERLLGHSHVRDIRRGISPREAAPADRWGNSRSPEDAGTTHISVVDAAGNAVAATTSVNTAFGAKLSVPGRDLLLNNTMDDFSIQPGVPNAFGLVGSEANAVGSRKRPLSSMAPTIVVRDGKVRAVAGASGGPLIITATLQTILGMLAFDLDVEEAVLAPRIHHHWRPDVLAIEPGVPSAVRSGLEARGHVLREWPHQGSVQAVEVIGEGEGRRIRAASDPRKGGLAAAY